MRAGGTVGNPRPPWVAVGSYGQVKASPSTCCFAELYWAGPVGCPKRRETGSAGRTGKSALPTASPRVVGCDPKWRTEERGGGSGMSWCPGCLGRAAESATSHRSGLGCPSAAIRSSLSQRERVGEREKGAIKPLGHDGWAAVPPHPGPLPPGEGKAAGCRRCVGCPSGQFRAGEHSGGNAPKVSATSDRTPRCSAR